MFIVGVYCMGFPCSWRYESFWYIQNTPLDVRGKTLLSIINRMTIIEIYIDYISVVRYYQAYRHLLY